MDLISMLRMNKNARKVFGQRELKIIEKQLLGVNLTQSEKNRLSRDIRKKFAFIKEAEKFSEYFELKKGFEITNLIEEAKRIILSDELFSRISKIFVYGSFVENNLALNSDIDLAVEFNKISLKEATVFTKRIYGKVNQKLDIQTYNFLDEKIKNEIKKKGKILYER